MNLRSPLFQKLAVLIPTLGVSALLAYWGVAVLPRVLIGLGVGMVLIMMVKIRQRRHE